MLHSQQLQSQLIVSMGRTRMLQMVPLTGYTESESRVTGLLDWNVLAVTTICLHAMNAQQDWTVCWGGQSIQIQSYILFDFCRTTWQKTWAVCAAVAPAAALPLMEMMVYLRTILNQPESYLYGIECRGGGGGGGSQMSRFGLYHGFESRTGSTGKRNINIFLSCFGDIILVFIIL